MKISMAIAWLPSLTPALSPQRKREQDRHYFSSTFKGALRLQSAPRLHAGVYLQMKNPP